MPNVPLPPGDDSCDFGRRVNKIKRILVVGAGVAGLQATKTLVEAGFKVLTLEAEDAVGGVWIKNYEGYGLQVPSEFYQFPDFPYPASLQPVAEYPSGQQIRDYVMEYAQHFSLYQHIKLNCRLVKLVRRAKGGYKAIYFAKTEETFFQINVDYVVISTGIYNNPYVPEYETSHRFKGAHLHAKHFLDARIVKEKHVIVVGAGKTALDCVCSVASAKLASSVTLLYRQAHWPVPRTFSAKVGVRNFLFNRAVASMLKPYYTESALAKFGDKLMTPFKKLFWCSIERVISKQFPMVEQFKPPVQLPDDLFYGGQILDNNFEDLLQTGNVNSVKGQIKSFSEMGVVLNDDTFLRADLVVYCTGYTRSYDFLDSESKELLGVQKDGLYLYRNVIPPHLPDMAFIGSEVNTYNNILTHGIQCRWLLSLLTGKLSLPEPEIMDKDVRQQQRWRRSVMPPQRCRGAVVMAYQQAYHDQLLKDMNVKFKRKGWNPLQECFEPYSAVDYKDIFEDVTLRAPYLRVKGRASTDSSRATSDRLSTDNSRTAFVDLVYASVSEPDVKRPESTESNTVDGYSLSSPSCSSGMLKDLHVPGPTSSPGCPPPPVYAGTRAWVGSPTESAPLGSVMTSLPEEDGAQISN